MHAPGTYAVVAALLMPALAAADTKPKSTPVDISAFKSELLVLTDADGGTYLVRTTRGEQRIFYGTGKTLYQQIVIGYSASEAEATWDISAYTPRLEQSPRGSVQRQQDGTYRRYCYGQQDAPLTLVTGDAAKKILDTYKPVTTAVYYVPYWFARDSRGTYYYVDQLSGPYGGKGYRVFLGKKGAMKRLPVTDVVVDSGGSVFATKTGDLRLVKTLDPDGNVVKTESSLFRGEKETKLVTLDTHRELPLIHNDLGIYGFMGTICDNPVPVEAGSRLP